MNLFNNITRGGQLQIHQLRMFHQIFSFALLISFVIALLFFIYQIDKDLPSKQQRYAAGYVKAKLLLSVTSIFPKMDVTQVVILDGKQVEVKSKYFDRDQTKYLPVKEANVSSLSGQELKHIDDEIERLGHFSARQLSELSHKDTPWIVAEDKGTINYQHVFYRPEETSVREYEPL